MEKTRLLNSRCLHQSPDGVDSVMAGGDALLDKRYMLVENVCVLMRWRGLGLQLVGEVDI